MIKCEQIKNAINTGENINSNCIYVNLKGREIDYILKNITPMIKPTNYKKTINVVENLNYVYYDDMLKYALNMIKLDEYVKFFDKNNLRKFNNILIEKNIHIQFVLYNLEHLLTLEQQHINNLYDYNSNNFNTVVLLKNNELSNYETTDQQKIKEKIKRL